MRRPSTRLINLGVGPDKVLTYAASYAADSQGNYLQTDTPGPTYSAIVTRDVAMPSTANNRMESMTTYKVMLYAATDPEIVINQVVTWLDPTGDNHTLKAQGDSHSCGPGAYQFAAQEIDSYPLNTQQPLQEQEHEQGNEGELGVSEEKWSGEGKLVANDNSNTGLPKIEGVSDVLGVSGGLSAIEALKAKHRTLRPGKT